MKKKIFNKRGRKRRKSGRRGKNSIRGLALKRTGILPGVNALIENRNVSAKSSDYFFEEKF